MKNKRTAFFNRIANAFLISSRLLSTEVQSREESRELTLLRRKSHALEQSNAELLGKVIRAQYKDRIPKSMTYDDIGPHLLSM